MVFRKVSISTKIFEKTNSVVTWIAHKPVLLTKYNGDYFAMEAVCGHMGCAILNKVEGKEAVCPAHGARYDVTNGNKVSEPQIKPEAPCEYDSIGEPLKTFKVLENNGFLEVDTD
ncbi:iron-sulfur protein [Thermoplasma volcanium GSS1]|uniref:Iron-sulfur protein n=1 Tax=Thermoplasma volcanium (strain ATCC 51530 / DSM 4299 / JCM 9571 / NBRC 15438 / GSS1) TaxID=273116 RepID=Q97A02_THEVO|nr:Rieske (2Fe-2S) protein [Thermoplasma volcanium]BAB60150.1 iron-sulfur protein [Thermoplasma volcanium GSS1]